MDNKEIKQTLTLNDRKTLEIDAVNDVIEFNSEELEISTKLGELIIEGEGLKISELSGELGRLYVTGKINGLFYKSESQKRKSYFAKK